MRTQRSDAAWLVGFLWERLLQELFLAESDVRRARRDGRVATRGEAERWLAEVERRRETLDRLNNVLKDAEGDSGSRGQGFARGVEAAALAWLEPMAEKYSDHERYPPKVLEKKRRSRRV